MAVDSWSEVAFINIAPIGYGELKFQTITETIDFDGGKKGVEWIATLAGGRVSKNIPQEPWSVTLELYPTQAGTVAWPAAAAQTEATGVHDIFDGAQTADGTQPITVVLDRVRSKVRLTFLVTDVIASTTHATQAIAATSEAYRESYADGYITQVKTSYTDGMEKATVTVEFPPFDKSGTACSLFESHDGTGAVGIDALADYTTTVKFRA